MVAPNKRATSEAVLMTYLGVASDVHNTQGAAVNNSPRAATGPERSLPATARVPMYRWESFWLIRPVITPADTALAIAVLTAAISMTTALAQPCTAVITSSPVTSGGAATITVPGSSASLRTRPAPISSATPCADGEGSLSNTSMPAARSPKPIEAPN